MGLWLIMPHVMTFYFRVNNYVKETKRNEWFTEDLVRAYYAVKSHTHSIRGAAVEYSVPRATLQRHIKRDEKDVKVGRYSNFVDAETETVGSSSSGAGPDWLHGFMKRCPELALRTPEKTSLNRLTSFNKVSRFYKLLVDATRQRALPQTTCLKWTRAR